MTPRKLPVGTILEIATARGLAYAQYVGKHSVYGDAIRVLPGLFPSRVDDLAPLASRQGYVTFYPVRVALREGLVETIGALSVPEGLGVPTRMRRRGAIANDGRVLTWIIEEGQNEALRRELSDDDAELPIASIWNHEMLTKRLADEWRPAQLR